MKAFGGFQESRAERPDLKLLEFTGSLLSLIAVFLGILKKKCTWELNEKKMSKALTFYPKMGVFALH